MVKLKEADSPAGPPKLHKTCNANRFEPLGSAGPHGFSVPLQLGGMDTSACPRR